MRTWVYIGSSRPPLLRLFLLPGFAIAIAIAIATALATAIATAIATAPDTLL
jgi:hypothetical protein